MRDDRAIFDATFGGYVVDNPDLMPPGMISEKKMLKKIERMVKGA